MIPTKSWLAVLALACACLAQESAPQKPQVKVNVLNVCSPSAEEQKEISSSLAGIPRKPAFSADFEIDRGRSVLDQGANLLASVNAPSISSDNSTADFVRLRRDLNGTAFSTVQYSFSRDDHQMVETLVFRLRDPKDVIQVSIEDTVSSVVSASAMLSASTPPSRIKLERFGKSSVVLARCEAQGDRPAPDQSAYEPLFSSAAGIMSEYRNLLDAKKLVPDELARIAGKRSAGSPKAAGASPKH